MVNCERKWRKVIGPLAHLTHEIIEEGNIRLFHMYNTSNFFKAAKKFILIKVKDNSINETKNIYEKTNSISLIPLENDEKIAKITKYIKDEYIIVSSD